MGRRHSQAEARVITRGMVVEGCQLTVTGQADYRDAGWPEGACRALRLLRGLPQPVMRSRGRRILVRFEQHRSYCKDLPSKDTRVGYQPAREGL